MFAACAKINLACHAVDLRAHFVKCRIYTLALGFDIFCYGMFDAHIWLVEDGNTGRRALDQRKASQLHGRRLITTPSGRLVNQVGIGDQFGQDHGNSLQGLDFYLFIFARFHVLDGKHANSTFRTDNGYACKAVKAFFARFGDIPKIRVRCGFIEVQRLHIFGNRANETFAQTKARDVHSSFVQATRCKKFKRPIAQQVNGTNFAR